MQLSHICDLRLEASSYVLRENATQSLTLEGL